MPTYFEVLLKGVPAKDEDLISSKLFELGAQGITQDLKFIQTAENFDPEIIPEESLNLKAFFTEVVTLEDLSGLKNFCQKIELNQEQEKDWLKEWKKHFKAFKLVGDFWLVPSWLDSPAEKEKTIRINPGLAFGTGTHPTTQAVAQLIHKELVEKKQTYKNVLDLGAGTGILSIMLSLLGVRGGVAAEIDPMAREKCFENLELNQMQGQFEIVDENYIHTNEKVFDLVVANIIDGVLLQLKNEIYKSFSKRLIVSGILDERNKNFQKNFIQDLNLEVEEALQLQDWWAYVLKKT